jgi:hypothetical protein
VSVNDAVKEGQELGVVKDWEGRVLQRATAEADGRVLFIVSSLAINKTDPLLAVGPDDFQLPTSNFQLPINPKLQLPRFEFLGVLG